MGRRWWLAAVGAAAMVVTGLSGCGHAKPAADGPLPDGYPLLTVAGNQLYLYTSGASYVPMSAGAGQLLPCTVYRLPVAGGPATRVAGDGHCGYSGDGGPALAARLGSAPDDEGFAIIAMAADPGGDVYLNTGHGIREVSAGTIRTIYGQRPPVDSENVEVRDQIDSLGIDSRSDLWFTIGDPLDGLYELPAGASTAQVRTNGPKIPGNYNQPSFGSGVESDTSEGPAGSVVTVDGSGRVYYELAPNCGIPPSNEVDVAAYDPATDQAMTLPASTPSPTACNDPGSIEGNGHGFLNLDATGDGTVYAIAGPYSAGVDTDTTYGDACGLAHHASGTGGFTPLATAAVTGQDSTCTLHVAGGGTVDGGDPVALAADPSGDLFVVLSQLVSGAVTKPPPGSWYGAVVELPAGQSTARLLATRG